MAAAGSGGNLQEEEASAAPGADLYAVLGLNRECTDAELKGAYRRLAMVTSVHSLRANVVRLLPPILLS
jgi:hypothetical protein